MNKTSRFYINMNIVGTKSTIYDPDINSVKYVDETYY